MPIIIEINDRFGWLTVTGRAAKPSSDRHDWHDCECLCGAPITVRSSRLRSGKTRSCGCLRRYVRAATPIARKLRSLLRSGEADYDESELVLERAIGDSAARNRISRCDLLRAVALRMIHGIEYGSITTPLTPPRRMPYRLGMRPGEHALPLRPDAMAGRPEPRYSARDQLSSDALYNGPAFDDCLY
jgi:hypothetical protein